MSGVRSCPPAQQRSLIALGLYRRKSENSSWRLSVVHCNPPWYERLEPSDMVFVLRERVGATSSESDEE